ncbi:UNKNOWN [Stylonychia lemnae]|uniref:Transmembrane protein n=1 Tax=Stylonychia lemnae TaxID=5949 RepID=A0A078AIL6_STYLE|nr:UNKNOWN [Stylonychia lemnae]|eukprot:CDW81332.1 UNKNOWN [Stylonychia lemnae]
MNTQPHQSRMDQINFQQPDEYPIFKKSVSIAQSDESNSPLRNYIQPDPVLDEDTIDNEQQQNEYESQAQQQQQQFQQYQPLLQPPKIKQQTVSTSFAQPKVDTNIQKPIQLQQKQQCLQPTQQQYSFQQQNVSQVPIITRLPHHSRVRSFVVANHDDSTKSQSMMNLSPQINDHLTNTNNNTDIINEMIQLSIQKQQLERKQQQIQIQRLQQELNEINNELARQELKIKYESVKLQYNMNRNYKLKATLLYSVILVLLMMLHNLYKGRSISMLGQVSLLDGLHNESLDAEQNEIIVISNDLAIEDDTTHINENVNPQIYLGEDFDYRQVKNMAFTFNQQKASQTLNYDKNIVQNKMRKMMADLYSYNSTIFARYQNYLQDPYRLINHRKSQLKMQKIKTPLKSYQSIQMQDELSNYLTQTDMVIEPIIRKLVEIGGYQQHHYVSIILNNLEVDIQTCKSKIAQKASQFMRDKAEQELHSIDDYTFSESSIRKQILSLRIELDSVILDDCFQNFKDQTQVIMQKLEVYRN